MGIYKTFYSIEGEGKKSLSRMEITGKELASLVLWHENLVVVIFETFFCLNMIFFLLAY